MPSPDLPPPPHTGFRRLLSPDVAVLTILVVVVAASATLAIGAVAAHFALTAEVRQIHARIDETNVRIDETNARIGRVHGTLAARIDETNARIAALNAGMNAKFDRLFALLQRSLQDYGRRLDAIERRLGETVPPSGAGATP